jgi:indolepyruvate ferredoxin oxidoreductase
MSMSVSTTAPLRTVTLDDKYTLREGQVFMTGIQALVRLTLEQRWRDARAGHDTAGYVTGYRGSPLGALDQQLTRARRHLQAEQVVFQPGVNEDLAATACWGTQQSAISGEARHDGVFAIWYGKGPGVDRSGDALRHGNLAGSSPLGGVLCLLGDDHTCESSTTAHHSEYAMMDASIAVLNPAGVQEILDYGLYGIALSRFSGAWAALKCVHDTVEATAVVDVDPQRVQIHLPEDYMPPEDGLHIRWPDTAQAQEARLYGHKLDAVRAFVRANALDRTVFEAPAARLGVVTAGKSYLDVRQALDDLEIDAARARALGLRLYKVAVPFPLEPEGIRAFCQGLDTVIVVEEKRSVIEGQLKDLLYGSERPPRIIGKRDADGATLFPAAGRLDTNHIGAVIGRELLAVTGDEVVRGHGERLTRLVNHHPEPASALQRIPYFCPGCPHNTSTRVPEGSKALAGIGCHYLSQFMDRETARFTQMGGEGASWVGEAPFSTRPHVFQNIGDGTYYHSGLLAIRAAIASGVNITFKILFNDAVAMTGGQPMDGPLSVPRISQQMLAEGARTVVVVTDEPHKYGRDAGFPPGVTVRHRDELDAVQRELREITGTTVLVYDQTCAAEKRRRRKRGEFPDPPQRLFINDAVCEGCGDCSVQSNCLAVVPVETPLGRKRAIDQSACNKDFSCLKGFCPSFVTVHGGRPRRGRALAAQDSAPDPPLPQLPALDRTYGIVITGVGGTGVITIGALIGMAAHISGLGCSILDQTGLAQKGGGVVSHVRLAPCPDDITATRIANGAADAVLAGDLLVTGTAELLATMSLGRTRVVANARPIMPGGFTRDRDLVFPAEDLRTAIRRSVDSDAARFLDATALATALMGDAIATNLFLLGYAWQDGLIPVGIEALEAAVALNGVAVEMNLAALRWGRRARHDVQAVMRAAFPGREVAQPTRESVEALTERLGTELTHYQDARYAARLPRMVAAAVEAQSRVGAAATGLAEAVARNYFKLLAYKDEYEVARLFRSSEFRDAIDAAFEGDYSLEFNLAPPLFARIDPNTGRPLKRRYGPWMMTLFGILARLKRLRGTAFDPFGRSTERRRERRLVREYEQMLEEVLPALRLENLDAARALIRQPGDIRGFGPVKEAAMDAAEVARERLLSQFRDPRKDAEAA